MLCRPNVCTIRSLGLQINLIELSAMSFIYKFLLCLLEGEGYRVSASGDRPPDCEEGLCCIKIVGVTLNSYFNKILYRCLKSCILRFNAAERPLLFLYSKSLIE